jgi:hypothetical protein
MSPGHHNHVYQNGRCIACDLTEEQVNFTTAAQIGISTKDATQFEKDRAAFEAAQIGEPDLLQKCLTNIEATGKALENATIERCAQVADSEYEAPGPMPLEFYRIPIEDAIRAAIRATKKSIGDRIRKLKDEL